MKKVLEALTQMQVKMPIGTVLLVLLIAFLVAMIIYITYKTTYSGVLYNPRFNLSLVMITMVTTIVMVVIGSNISVSLGMVGALSIIRFRTAVKDPRDTAFIFWAVVSGLACGTQNYTIVLIGSLFLCLILFVFRMIVKTEDKYMLVVKGKDFDINSVEKINKKELKSFLLKGKYIKNSNIELVYEIKLKNKNSDKLVNSLRELLGVDTVNIVSSNTDTMG